MDQMTLPEYSATQRLCIYCRKLESTSQPCPVVAKYMNATKHRSSTKVTLFGSGTGVSNDDHELLLSLQNHPSSLCNRCSAYNIINVFRKSQPRDMMQGASTKDPAFYTEESQRYIDMMAPFRLHLGKPPSVLLTPSCQFCRLLYCILPRDLNAAERDVHVEPFRSHVRQEGWEIFPNEMRSCTAIFLGLADVWSPFTPVSDPFRSGEDNIRFPMMTGPALSLDTRSALPDRIYNNARLLSSMLDLSLLLQPLEHCQKHHGDVCSAIRPPELLTTRMIEVHIREVVPCPVECDYVALSYVWGGVQPAANALRDRCLPNTVEDAITVTKALGRRYLWVDALCIDQSPNPTPEVLKEKMQQLGMMATIYGCATVTIVALTGINSNAGLAGVSVSRPHQIVENIGEHRVFTVPQYISAEREASAWSSRAWTLQEELLSLRLLIFTESQVDYSCIRGSFWEGLDIETSYTGKVPAHPSQSLAHMMARAPNLTTSSDPALDPGTQGRMRLFDGVLQAYTGRRMTNAEDSLNAFLGMLTGLQRRLFPQGFSHGLPLLEFPATLAWIHDRNSKPSRRPMFPSWTWAGWEGTASIARDVLNSCETDDDMEVDLDLELRVLSLNGNELTIEGWIADLSIRTQPFSEVHVPGKEDSIAAIMEGNFLHNNTIQTGQYSCLVVQRQCDKNSRRAPPRQKTFALVLEWLGDGLAQRRTMITITSFAGCDFMDAKPEKRAVRLL